METYFGDYFKGTRYLCESSIKSKRYRGSQDLWKSRHVDNQNP